MKITNANSLAFILIISASTCTRKYHILNTKNYLFLILVINVRSGAVTFQLLEFRSA